MTDAKPTHESQGEEGLTGRRAAARVRLSLPAQIETIRGVQRVTLVDLSLNGAQIAADETPAVGSDLVLKCGPIDVFATVSRVAAGRCGLRFDEAIVKTQLLTLRLEAEEAARSPHADQWRAAREWAVGR